MSKTVLHVPTLSQPRGVFCHGVKAEGQLVFVSGQVAYDARGEIVGRGDIKAQTRQALENVKAVLEAAGATMQDVTKVTVFVTNMAYLAQIHEVRAEYWPDPQHYPASTLVEVKSLVHPDLLIEIEAFAVI
ncbi:MAG: RidA family protein [Nitrospinota bacterium]|nr:MAG: RidA family protein [Nitrospinota bacterium]